MGKNGQTYQVKYYNLDMIISIGYRANSKKSEKEYVKNTTNGISKGCIFPKNSICLFLVTNSHCFH